MDLIEIILIIENELTPLAREKMGIEVPRIPIKMTTARARAGCFIHDEDNNGTEYRFSSWAAEHEPDFKQNVIHEFAHHVQLVKYGYTNHDYLFRNIMSILGGSRKIHHNYHCGAKLECLKCGYSCPITVQKAKRIRPRLHAYYCNECKSHSLKIVMDDEEK